MKTSIEIYQYMKTIHHKAVSRLSKKRKIMILNPNVKVETETGVENHLKPKP